jgi:hypothetical protein
MDRTNIKCQNGPVLPPSQVFYSDQALHNLIHKSFKIFNSNLNSHKCNGLEYYY